MRLVERLFGKKEKEPLRIKEPISSELAEKIKSLTEKFDKLGYIEDSNCIILSYEGKYFATCYNERRDIYKKCKSDVPRELIKGIDQAYRQ
ncbi:hypothetical protein GF336_00435 [Candidatus Woesearchaeota archaeon]|nr:hypothetical protein [Candidatus Woesearchaeota archaeon]